MLIFFLLRSGKLFLVNNCQINCNPEERKLIGCFFKAKKCWFLKLEKFSNRRIFYPSVYWATDLMINQSIDLSLNIWSNTFSIQGSMSLFLVHPKWSNFFLNVFHINIVLFLILLKEVLCCFISYAVICYDRVIRAKKSEKHKECGTTATQIEKTFLFCNVFPNWQFIRNFL